MKNKGLPGKKEWERITDEAFSSDDMHIFSAEYQYRKESIQKGRIIMKKHNFAMNLTVAVTALAVVAFPTGIYLSARTSETTSQYAEVSEKSTTETMSNETLYALEMGWLPEGMTLQKEETESGKEYGYNADETKMWVLFLKNSGENPVDNIIYHDNTRASQEYEISDDKRVIYNYNAAYDEETGDPQNVGREIFIEFKDTKYMAHLFLTDDVSMEDTYYIIKGMKLTESDTETALLYSVQEGDSIQTEESDNEQPEQRKESYYPASSYNDDIYTYEFGWLPEGLEHNKEIPCDVKFHNETTGGGMTPVFLKVAKDKTFVESINFVESTTVSEFNGMRVSMNYRDNYDDELRDPNNFGRVAVIYFDNTPYILKLFITDDVTEEDFRHIIEEVRLVPSEEEIAGIYQIHPEDIVECVDTDKLRNAGTPADECSIYNMHEAVPESHPDVWGDVSATVDSISFGNTLDGIKTDGIGWDADYSKFLKDDGTLKDNVRTWYDYTHDVNDALNKKIIYRGTIPASVMTLNITYTNNGIERVDDYCICPNISTLYDNYFVSPMLVDLLVAESEYEYEGYLGFGDDLQEICYDDMFFSLSTPNKNGKNSIHLDAGESTTVTLVYLVEDEYRDNLYLKTSENNYINISGK